MRVLSEEMMTPESEGAVKPAREKKEEGKQGAKPEREKEHLSLEAMMMAVLGECRMVLPGVQALFGFQLIAVFNQNFSRMLSAEQQRWHLAATALTAVAVALVMAPAAYHRQVEPHAVSRHVVDVGSWLLTVGMVPLLLAITIDFVLVSQVILPGEGVVGVIGGGLFCVFAGLWYVLPRVGRRWVKRKG